MRTSPTEGFVDANGVSLHYALAGDSGRSVVLLHELGGTTRHILANAKLPVLMAH